MLPNLLDIETAAGRITLGATVRSTRYDVQGIVTSIHWAGHGWAIQVDNRHSDDASKYELLSPRTLLGFNYVNPNSQEALSGKYEVLVAAENDRIYFADSAEQAIALIAATCGLRNEAEEVAYLKRRAAVGPVDELRWRGQAGGSLAYVSAGKQRPGPRFQVGDKVSFYCTAATYTVSGVALLKDRLNYGKTQWHYFYAEARGIYEPMSEAQTRPAMPLALAA